MQYIQTDRQGRPPEAALDAFQRALLVRIGFPEDVAPIRFAKDAVAEALRALVRTAEAELLPAGDAQAD